jgi:hypothetical protein
VPDPPIGHVAGTHTAPEAPSPPYEFVPLIRAHRADDSVTTAIGRILRADLAVVDDIGLLPAGPDAAEGLCRLADAACELRAVLDVP